MKKELSEMSLEELWQLFPIFLVKHNDNWNNWYKEEKKYLESLVNDRIVRISHIGSTAISNIQAKNIVDVLIEVKDTNDMKYISDTLCRNGYLLMSQDENRISLNKGYTKNGFSEKVFHTHIRLVGDNNELYFKDYLNEYFDVAQEYEKLKVKLWHMYEHDRDGYTNAKTEFIKKYTEIAKIEYNYKYKDIGE